jgi:hypothetical protein
VVLIVLLPFLASSNDDEKQNSYRPPYTPEERAAEYIRRGHTWPIVDFLPNTTGWSNLMKRRISQVQAIQDPQQKYDGWIETLAMALTTPNFTEFGWGLTQGPPALTEELRTAVYEGLPNVRSEGRMLEIDGPNPPDFLDRPDLTQKVSSIIMRGISPSYRTRVIVACTVLLTRALILFSCWRNYNQYSKPGQESNWCRRVPMAFGCTGTNKCGIHSTSICEILNVTDSTGSIR